MAPSNSDSNNFHYKGPEKIIADKKEYLLPCSYHFYKNPPQIVRGKGTKLFDSTGKEYTDFFAGVTVMNCGHCNEKINQQVIEQLQSLQHTTSIYLTQPVVDLAEKLAEVLPGSLSRSFFCNSGSEANEGAMLLARVYTGKRDFIALEGGLHGRTFLTSGATGIPMWRTDPFCDEVPVHFAGNAEEVCRLLEEKGDTIAALLVEPIQGNGGIRPLPGDFFDRVAPLLKEKNVLLICDEIQTGFARTGKMFAIEYYGIQPDILTGAKALGNGFPIGFFATTPEVAGVFKKPSASTLGGNPVSCQAGMAVLDFIREEGLVEQAREKGRLLLEGLNDLSKGNPQLGDPRGFGLMLGLPVLGDGNSDPAEMTDRILEEMKDQGFLMGKNGLGRDTLAFQPPLIISEAEIRELLEALKIVLGEI